MMAFSQILLTIWLFVSDIFPFKTFVQNPAKTVQLYDS